MVIGRDRSNRAYWWIAAVFAVAWGPLHAASPSECEAHARSIERSYGGSLVGGAARGAVRGAVVGSILGDRKGRRRGAALGAIAGGARRAARRSDIFRRAYDDCMRGRM
jgi:outer membrane lipoprotein SlyB